MAMRSSAIRWHATPPQAMLTCRFARLDYSLVIGQGRVRQHDQLGFAGVGACGSEVNVGGKITSEEGLGRAGAESGSHCGSSASGNLR